MTGSWWSCSKFTYSSHASWSADHWKFDCMGFVSTFNILMKYFFISLKQPLYFSNSSHKKWFNVRISILLLVTRLQTVLYNDNVLYIMERSYQDFRFGKFIRCIFIMLSYSTMNYIGVNKNGFWLILLGQKQYIYALHTFDYFYSYFCMHDISYEITFQMLIAVSQLMKKSQRFT